MPSLMRLLFVLGVIAGLVYGAMYAIVVYTEPTPREVIVEIPTDQINPVRVRKPVSEEPADSEGG